MQNISKQQMNKRNYKCIYIGGKQIGVDCLKQLLKYGIKPQLVIANIDDKGKDTWYDSTLKFARKNNLETISGKKVKDTIVIKAIKSIKSEIIFCIGGTQLIPQEVLEVPTLGCLNIHPALLPKYRGRYSTVHAMFNREKYTGVTIHWMDVGIDSGPIIVQKKITIENSDTAKSLYDKFTKIGVELFTKFLQDFTKGKKIISRSQDNSKATYYPQGLPNGGEIDWNWSGKQIYSFIKSMTFEPFPPVSFKIGNKKMVIVDEKYFKGFNK